MEDKKNADIEVIFNGSKIKNFPNIKKFYRGYF